jgi:FAD/FMN-containing dehydrogenase
MNSPGGIAAAIREGVDAPVETSPEARHAYSTNFGGVFEQTPAVVVRAASEADVVHTLRVCREAGVPVSVRGSGHSFANQGLSGGGVLIVNAADTASFKLHENGDAEVTTRTLWRELELALNRLGRAVPVLTNHLSVTVGGTLSVGGYGEGTVAGRGQIDLVRGLRLIRPDGRALWCSPEENAELFGYALASLGQAGFVEAVVLRTRPYRRRAHVFIQQFADLPALIASASWMARGPAPLDFFSGQHYEGAFYATYGLLAEEGAEGEAALAELGAALAGHETKRVEFDDWPLRSVGAERRNKWDADSYFVWSDYVVDVAHAGRMAAFLSERVVARPAYARGNGRVLLLAMRRPEGKHYFPFEPITPTMKELVFGFGLYFRVPKSRAGALRDVQRLERETLERCLELGGRPYLAGWYDWDEGLKRQIYGASLDTLRRIRAEADPANLFNANLLV